MGKMKRIKIVASIFMVVLLAVGLVSSVAAQVEPSEVEMELAPGECAGITKEVTTPAIPPVVDILLLEDETGSFGDDIATLQALAPDIWDAVADEGVDFTMGVGGFRDFDQSYWGSPGDHVYRLLQDLTSDKDTFINGVNSLTAGGGGDGPEAQLEALHYMATPGHAAIDSNGDGDTTDPQDTPMGQQPTWRAEAQRVVLLATDASCHVTGDAGGWPGDAGTTSANVTGDILAGAGIIVIGLTPGGAGTISCIDTLASKTGGSVQATTASGEDVLEAIMAGLKELTTDVWWKVVAADEGLRVMLGPPVHYAVPGDTTVLFGEKICVAHDLELQCKTLTAKVVFFANTYPEEGEVIGKQMITVKVRDITPPEASCVEGVNPHGKNVPGGKAAGKGQGVNPDGFYELIANDNCDPDPDIYVTCRGCKGLYPDILPFGPFKSGIVVKLTEAPGAMPSCKEIGSDNGKAGAVTWHITLPGEPIVFVVDDSGNMSWFPCFVPPPPK
jgi:hypothetical protein